MENPSFSSSLYDCATECALRRQNSHCMENFGGDTCNDCRFYINKYINADPRHVELFMLEAETRASAIKSAGSIHHPIFFILIALCLVFAWQGYKGEQKRNAWASQTQSVEQPQQSATQKSSTVSIYSEIEATLRKVETDLKKNIDVNKDGLLNCIDAALHFYKYFPDKSKVCILLNYNKETGMNHLFNGVLVDGVWRAVEPQAAYSGKSPYWMRDVWGGKYDSKLNKDVTSEYSRYIKN